MYGLHFREELPPVVADELEALVAAVRAFLYTEHNEDGTHNKALFPLFPINVGMTLLWPTTEAPSQWVLCDGQLLSRGQYQSLFFVIGEQYGAGDGTSTFAVPNVPPITVGASSLHYIMLAGV